MSFFVLVGGWSSEDESEPSSGSEVPSRESSAGSYKGGQSTRRHRGLSQLPPVPTPRNQYSQQLTVDIPNHGMYIWAVMQKTVFGISDQERLNPVCSAIETTCT